MSSTIQAELSRLYEKHGKLTAQIVVEAARSKKSPIHDEFEWDDSKAAIRYRLYQARTLIRKVHVLVVGGTAQTIHHVPIRAATSDDERSDGRYLVERDLIRDVDARQRAIDEAQRYLDGAIKRLEELRSVLGVNDASRFDVALRAIEAAKVALAA